MAGVKTYPLTDDGVRKALADLDKGGSEDVAIRLEELGVTGRLRDNASTCPIAVYVQRSLPDAEHVVVEREQVYVRGIAREFINGFPNSRDFEKFINLPDSVSAFVEDFDQGMYPELVESTGEVSTDVPAA